MKVYAAVPMQGPLSIKCQDPDVSIADHGVRIAAFGVQVGVGVVFGDSKAPGRPLLAIAADTWKAFTDQMKAPT